MDKETPMTRTRFPQTMPFKEITFSNYNIERIFDPLKTYKPIEQLLDTIDDIVKKSLGNKGLGREYIKKRLSIAKEVIFVRDLNSGEITHYFRKDIYSEIRNSPCGLAMYKLPKCIAPSGFTTQIMQKILLEELESRVTAKIVDPKLILISRTFNPRIYQIRNCLPGVTYPNITLFKALIDKYLEQEIRVYLMDPKLKITNKFLMDEIILINGKPFKYKLVNEELRSILANGELSFNLKNIKLLRSEFYKDELFSKKIYEDIRTIYAENIPQEHRKLINYIMANYYPANINNDFKMCIVGNAMPNLSEINPAIAITSDQIINEFFEGFLKRNQGENLFFCTELSFFSLKKRLEENEAYYIGARL